MQNSGVEAEGEGGSSACSRDAVGEAEIGGARKPDRVLRARTLAWSKRVDFVSREGN